MTNKATKSSRRLPDHYKRNLAELLIVLEENPVPSQSYDIAKMKGLVDTFRVRLGDIRVVYKINWESRHVIVLVVSPRGSAYG